MNKGSRHISSSLFILILLSFKFLNAQDLHFSLFDWQANYNNPALTGINPETQVGLQYRDQGFRVSENSYRSFSLFADSYMNREVRDHDHLGIGGTIIYDRAGSGNINTLQALVNLAYHLNLSTKTNTRLSLSPQFGIVQRELLDLDLFQFEEELLGGGFTEQFLNTNSQYIDAGFGLALTHPINQRLNMILGYSIHHLNNSQGDFTELNIDKIQKRDHLHAFISYQLTETMNTAFQFHWHKSGLFRETIWKQNLNIELPGSEILSLDLGLAYRSRDAFIFSVGLAYDQFDFALAYDVNSSELAQASNPSAAIELGIKYHIPFNTRQELIYIPFLSKKNYSPRLNEKTERPTPSFLEIEALIALEDTTEIKHETMNTVAATIYFGFDEDVINPKYDELADHIRTLNKQHPDAKWTITGHTDSRGSTHYNQLLGLNRAEKVLEWLKLNQINLEYISIQSEGETKLLNDCKDGTKCTRDEHAMNRRAELTVKLLSQSNH